MKPYYYVYRHGNEGPRVRHATIEQAKAEAERLAEKHPGLSFEILQCVGFASTSKASTFWADGCEPKPEPDNGWIKCDESNKPPPGVRCYIRTSDGWESFRPLYQYEWIWADVTHYKLA